MSPVSRPAWSAGLLRLHRRDRRAGRLRQARAAARCGAAAALVPAADADVAAPHPAVPDDLAQHEIAGVGRHREADALRARDDGGVDADHLAGRGDQRAARIAGIERRVGLDHVLDQPADLRAQRAAERRDDAGRHRGVEAERVADRDRDLAAPQRFESPSRAAGSATSASTRSSARSVSGSSPSTRAGKRAAVEQS